MLFGPSGSGKSTVLAAVAGLLRRNKLDVVLNGEKLHRMPAHRRRIGMVFQDGRLFPHMTVKEQPALRPAARAARQRYSSTRRWRCWALRTAEARIRPRFPAANASAWRSAAPC